MTAEVEWPPGRPRILITDSWLANAGDAAISLGLDATVRTIAPTASILHASYQYREIGPLLGDLRFVAPLEELLGTPWAPPGPGWEERGAELVAAADLVICQAAGALVEAYGSVARIVALSDVVERGIPLALVGLTASPWSRAAARRELRKVFGAAALVTVRDPHSLAVAADLGAGQPVFGTDPALALFPEFRHQSTRSGISVVLTNHHPDAERRRAAREAAGRVLREVVAAAAGEPVSVWSTVQGFPALAGEDDAEVAAELVSDLDLERGTIEVLTGYITPRRAIDLVAGSRALVTMRLHPSLMAAATGTPFALVLDGQRTGVFDGTGLETRIVNPFDSDGPRVLIDRILGEPSDPVGLWNALSPLRNRLEDTHARLRQVIEACADRSVMTGTRPSEAFTP